MSFFKDLIRMANPCFMCKNNKSCNSYYCKDEGYSRWIDKKVK
jgi:hypothetical protein